MELLNPEDEDHLQFIKELIQRWKPKVGNNVTVYQKEKEEEVFQGTCKLLHPNHIEMIQGRARAAFLAINNTDI